MGDNTKYWVLVSSYQYSMIPEVMQEVHVRVGGDTREGRLKKWRRRGIDNDT